MLVLLGLTSRCLLVVLPKAVVSSHLCIPVTLYDCCRSRTAVAPLERLKILMQVQGSHKTYTGVWQVCGEVANLVCPQAHGLHQRFACCGLNAKIYIYIYIYICVCQGLVLMAKNEGLRGMFRGNWTNCVRIVPNSAIKFLTYEQLTRSASSPLHHMCNSRPDLAQLLTTG